MIKKLLITLLTIFSLIGESKSQDYPTVVHQDWQLSSSGSNGESFYWAVTRSVNKFQGYYVYDIYFASNSYFYNYNTGQYEWTYTYINNVYALVNGQYVTKNPAWLTFKDKFTYAGLRVFSAGFPVITLQYDPPIIP